VDESRPSSFGRYEHGFISYTFCVQNSSNKKTKTCSQKQISCLHRQNTRDGQNPIKWTSLTQYVCQVLRRWWAIGESSTCRNNVAHVCSSVNHLLLSWTLLIFKTVSFEQGSICFHNKKKFNGDSWPDVKSRRHTKDKAKRSFVPRSSTVVHNTNMYMLSSAKFATWRLPQ
jgi:hypothetical protein